MEINTGIKYFLTGATGYIGDALCRRLLNDGNEVVALYRTEIPLFQHENLHWVKGHLEDPDSLFRAMEGCTHVFHCAGLARQWHPDKNAFYKINVAGTENVLQAAATHKIEGLVFTSSAGVIGKSMGVPMTEDDARLEPFDNDYDLTKHLAEEKVRQFARNHQAVIVNPSGVFGPGLPSPSNPISKTLKNYIENPFYFVPGNGESIRNFVFIDDVVNGHLLAMEKGSSGERYIIGGENISFNELFGHFEKLTGLKRIRVTVPEGIFKVISPLVLGISKLMNKEPFITPAWARRLFHPRLLSSQKAIDELGYAFTPVKEGLIKTLDSMGYERKKRVQRSVEFLS